MYKNYLIEKYHHRSTNKFKLITGKIHKEFRVIFHKNCIYDPALLPYTGINKLIGFTRFHHIEQVPIFKKYINSWKFGWVSDNKGIRLAFYIDKWGFESRTYSRVHIQPDSPIILRFIEVNAYERSIELQIVSETGYILDRYREVIPNIPRIGYWIFPYFGGRSKAPHNMNILIEEIK